MFLNIKKLAANVKLPNITRELGTLITKVKKKINKTKKHTKTTYY